jgi:hypothetical protein
MMIGVSSTTGLDASEEVQPVRHVAERPLETYRVLWDIAAHLRSSEEVQMEALRQIIDDAPDEIIVPIPTEWRHRRIQIVLSAVDRPDPVQPESEEHPYQVLKVPRRVISARDDLHER